MKVKPQSVLITFEIIRVNYVEKDKYVEKWIAKG